MDENVVKVSEAIVSTVTPKSGDAIFVHLKGKVNPEYLPVVRSHIESRLAEKGIDVTVIVLYGLEGVELSVVSPERLARAGDVNSNDFKDAAHTNG